MSKKVWGPIVWNMLHCLTIKIKDTHFMEQKDNLTYIILNICANLPCPTCSAHAISILRRVDFDKVTNKQDLVNLVFNLHNNVNKRTKKKMADKQVLDKYRKMNFKEVLLRFFELYFEGSKSSKMMMYTLHKGMASNEIFKRIKMNLNKYNN